MNTNEKKCQFCSENIKIDAIKCKFCLSDLNSKNIDLQKENIENKNISEKIKCPKLWNRFIILIMVLPFIIEIISFSSSLIFGGLVYLSYWWLLPSCLLTSYLCFLDSRLLDKQSVKIRFSILFGFIFPPVYLFIRGSALNKKFNLGFLKSQLIFFAYILITIIYAIFGYFLEKLFLLIVLN